MARTSLYSFLGLFWVCASFFAQTPYYGPTSPAQGNAIQVQLMVYDQQELGGLKIESVSFNGKTVQLQPPDLYGFRGGGGFQLYPGKYSLQWRVSKDQSEWPRSLSYKKTITIQPRDTWVQVTIKGDQLTVL